MDPPDLWNDSSETSLRKQKVLYLASRHHVRGFRASDWVSQLWVTHSLFLLEFAVLISVENSKMAVAEPKSSCVAAVRMDAWPMIGVIWPWRCCQKIETHGKWQLFVVCIYSGIKIGPTFSLGQAYRSGISILALFISPLVIWQGSRVKRFGCKCWLYSLHNNQYKLLHFMWNLWRDM